MENGRLIVPQCEHLMATRINKFWVQPRKQSSMDDGKIIAVAIQLGRNRNKPISIASKPRTGEHDERFVINGRSGPTDSALSQIPCPRRRRKNRPNSGNSNVRRMKSTERIFQPQELLTQFFNLQEILMTKEVLSTEFVRKCLVSRPPPSCKRDVNRHKV